jgi:hypothetical protein
MTLTASSAGCARVYEEGHRPRVSEENRKNKEGYRSPVRGYAFAIPNRVVA